MGITRKTNLGSINITDDVIASLAGAAVSECYGVVGLTSKNILKDTYCEILGIENLTKGVTVRNKNGIEIDVYVVLGYGVKISQVLIEAQKRIKYTIEKNLDIDIDSVNVFVQGVNKD